MFSWLWRRRRVTTSAKRWRRLARSVTRHTFLTYLAEQVAKDLLNRKPSSLTMEELSEAVLECSSDIQYQAERFIERFYFDYPFYDEEFFELVSSFRHLIDQQLLRMKSHGDRTN